MLLLPSDVSAVNAMGVEVRHLLEWWCVVCDAINVRHLPLPPQSTRPLESHSYGSIRVNPLCIHLPEWACRSHPMKNAINLINLSGVAKSNYSPTPHTLHNLSALKNASAWLLDLDSNKIVWSSELHKYVSSSWKCCFSDSFFLCIPFVSKKDQ